MEGAGMYRSSGGGSSNSGGNCSNLSVLVQNQNQSQRVPSSSGPLFLSASSSSPFLGSRSMVSFEDVHQGNRPVRSFFQAFDQEETGEDDLEEYFHQPEKKRRLPVNQVQFLEKSFEVDNKLDPERKIQLAKELGLQPRQVAIWFQNRRARWKTKQMEKDYDVLQASFNSLKADFNNLVKEKDKLKTEVTLLSDKLFLKEKGKGTSELSTNVDRVSQEQLERPNAESVSECEVSKEASVMEYKREGISSVKSDILESSEDFIENVHSPILEAGDSSYVFEPDQQSDSSQEEDDNLSKSFFPQYIFPKLEDVDYSDHPLSSCNFGYPAEDHAFWSWSY